MNPDRTDLAPFGVGPDLVERPRLTASDHITDALACLDRASLADTTGATRDALWSPIAQLRDLRAHMDDGTF